MSRTPDFPVLKPLRALPGTPFSTLAGAWAEILLLVLLGLTLLAVAFQHQILDRTIRLTPGNIASKTIQMIDDKADGGKSVITRQGPLKWRCALNAGIDYPYCAYEIFFDAKMGTQGLDLTHAEAINITMAYTGPAKSYRVYLKNFNPLYSTRTDDSTPKSLRVEPLVTSGRPETSELILDDFAVPDWWLRARGLAPKFGRPEFSNITSMTFETGTDAPVGVHEFEVREVMIRTSVLSEAQWYSVILAVWAICLAAYLGWRLSSLRKSSAARRRLEALALKEAQEAARRDPLTGLLNRRGLTERHAALAVQKPEPRPMAVIVLDVDHFKRLNDTHGHGCGDDVLKALGALLSANVRSVDLVARWGGEEFVIVCADVDRRGASRIAQKLRAQIAVHNFAVCGRVTASFGISWSPVLDGGLDGLDGLDGLVAQADAALYDAKAAGRNCCRFYKVSAEGSVTPASSRIPGRTPGPKAGRGSL